MTGVRVRYAPSPTGRQHIGNIRTTIFCWLFARQTGGQFVVRLEDTDRERYVPEGVPLIFRDLLWLGLDWDEGPDLPTLASLPGVKREDLAGLPDVGGLYGPYVQSRRLPIYRQYADELLAAGAVYRCDCSPARLEEMRREQVARKQPPGYDRRCRYKRPGEVDPQKPHVLRLAVPESGTTTVHDLIRGEITWDNRHIEDQILLKSDGFPTYHFAVVVDDHLMRISHILRGEDWIPSTPKQVLLYQAFGWEMPTFVHVPLVNGEDGRKLSKRHGATSVTAFKDEGYLSEALLNFLALLGWSAGSGEEGEIFSREELVRRFRVDDIQKAPAVFAYTKLNWMNGVYIRQLPDGELARRVYPFLLEAGLEVDHDKLLAIIPHIRERLQTLKEAVNMTSFLFTQDVAPQTSDLIAKGTTRESALAALTGAHQALAGVETWNETALEAPLRALAERLGLKAGALFMVVRVAATGRTVTPPLFASLTALGREATLKRLAAAAERLAP